NDTGIKDSFMMFSLVGLEAKEIESIIDKIFLQEDFDVFVIDSILDIVDSMNNESEAKKLVLKIQKLIKQKNCLFISVIHSNYESSKLLGHLGSLLEKKGECSFYLSRQEGYFKVQCKNCRREPFDDFYVIIQD